MTKWKFNTEKTKDGVMGAGLVFLHSNILIHSDKKGDRFIFPSQPISLTNGWRIPLPGYSS